MDKQTLQDLSSKRLVNLTSIYKSAGLSPADVNTRLRRPRCNVPDEWLVKIERRLMDQISEIVQAAGLDLTELIPRMIADLDTHFDQMNVFKNMNARQVEPIGYITRANKEVLAIYLPNDVYKPRSSEHDSRSRFLSINQIFDLEGNLELTERGRVQLALMAKKNEAPQKD